MKCAVCNRPLTSEKSIELGMGPVCAKNHNKQSKRQIKGWFA